MDYQHIREHLASFTKLPVESITADKAITELVADSFVLVEMMLTLQEQYCIVLSQEDLAEVTTVADLVDLIVERGAATPKTQLAH